jgi:hypothetical protein
LKGEYKTEFEKWKQENTNDTTVLYNRLVEINKKDPITVDNTK